MPLAMRQPGQLASVLAPGLNPHGRAAAARVPSDDDVNRRADRSVNVWATATADMLLNESNSDDSDGEDKSRVIHETLATWAGRTDTSLRRAAANGDWDAAAAGFLSDDSDESPTPRAHRADARGGPPGPRPRRVESPILSSVSSGPSDDDRPAAREELPSDATNDAELAGVERRQRRLRRLEQRRVSESPSKAPKRRGRHAPAPLADALASDSESSMASAREWEARVVHAAGPPRSPEQGTQDLLAAHLEKMSELMAAVTQRQPSSANVRETALGTEFGVALSRVTAEMEDLRRDAVHMETKLRTQSAVEQEKWQEKWQEDATCKAAESERKAAEQASQLVAAARTQSEEILVSARTLADRETKKQVEILLAGTRQEAESIVTAARREAEESVGAARRQADLAQAEVDTLRSAAGAAKTAAQAEALLLRKDAVSAKHAAAEAESEKQALWRKVAQLEDQARDAHSAEREAQSAQRESQAAQREAQMAVAAATQKELQTQVETDEEARRLGQRLAGLENEAKRIHVLEEQVRASQSTQSDAAHTSQKYQAESETEKLRLRNRLAQLESLVASAQSDHATRDKAHANEITQYRDREASKIQALELHIEQARTLVTTQADARVNEIQRIADSSIDEARHDVELMMAEQERSLAELRAASMAEAKRDREAAARAEESRRNAMDELGRCRDSLQRSEDSLAAAESSLQTVEEDYRNQVAAKASALASCEWQLVSADAKIEELHAGIGDFATLKKELAAEQGSRRSVEDHAATLQADLKGERDAASMASVILAECETQLAATSEQLRANEKNCEGLETQASKAVADVKAEADRRCNDLATEAKHALDDAKASMASLQAELEQQRAAQSLADECAAAAKAHVDEQLVLVGKDARERVAQAQQLQAETVGQLKQHFGTQLESIEGQANARIESAEKYAAAAEARRGQAETAEAKTAETNQKLQDAMHRMSANDDTRLREAEARAELSVATAALAEKQMSEVKAAMEAGQRSSEEHRDAQGQALRMEQEKVAQAEKTTRDAQLALDTASQAHQIEVATATAGVTAMHKWEVQQLNAQVEEQKVECMQQQGRAETLATLLSELDAERAAAGEESAAALAALQSQLVYVDAAKKTLEDSLAQDVQAVQIEADKKLVEETKIIQESADEATKHANEKVKEMAAQCSKRVSQTSEQAQELVKSSVRRVREQSEEQRQKDKDAAFAEAKKLVEAELAQAMSQVSSATEAKQAVEDNHASLLDSAAQGHRGELAKVTAELAKLQQTEQAQSAALAACRSSIVEMEAAAEAHSVAMGQMALQLTAAEEVATVREPEIEELKAAALENKERSAQSADLESSLAAVRSALAAANTQNDTAQVMHAKQLEQQRAALTAEMEELSNAADARLASLSEPLRTVSSIPFEQEQTFVPQHSMLQTQLSVELQDTRAQLEQQLQDMAAAEVQRHVRGNQSRKNNWREAAAKAVEHERQAQAAQQQAELERQRQAQAAQQQAELEHQRQALEQQRLSTLAAKQRGEQQRAEHQRAEQQRADEQRVEQQRNKAELERQQQELEQQRLSTLAAKQRGEKQMAEQQRRADEQRVEQQRKHAEFERQRQELEQQRLAQLAEQERAEKQLEVQQQLAEEQRAEQAHVDQQRKELERIEQSRAEQQRAEQTLIEQEQVEEQRQEFESIEQERVEQQQLEQEHIEAQRQEFERIDQEQRAEQQRKELERIEQHRIASIDEQRCVKQERVEQERLEQERLDRELPLPKVAANGPGFATLVCREEGDPWTYVVCQQRVSLGRTVKGELSCDCAIGPDKFISREHAVIECDTSQTPPVLTLQCVCSGRAWVTPLGKREEVVELTQRSAPLELHDDDEIRIGRAAGDVRFVIEIPGGEGEAEQQAAEVPLTVRGADLELEFEAGTTPNEKDQLEPLEPGLEVFSFDETGPLGIIFGESRFPENRLNANSPLMTVIDSVKRGSMAARLYGDAILLPPPEGHERIVWQVNTIDVAELGFDETLSLIKGPRPLVLRTVIHKRGLPDNSAGEYEDTLADGSLVDLQTPLPPVTEETLSDLATSPSPRDASPTTLEPAHMVLELATPAPAEDPAAAQMLTPESVREMARYLGIHEDKEVHLLPIARSALLETLPAGWEERVSSGSEVPYFVEVATGRTSVEHPADGHYRSYLEEARATSPRDAADADPGEMQFFDSETQQNYTHNFRTGQSYIGSVTDDYEDHPAEANAGTVSAAVLAFAKLPDAAVGRTPGASASDSMMGLTPDKLLEAGRNVHSDDSGSKQLFPSSPAPAPGGPAVATSPMAHLDNSMNTTQTQPQREVVQIQANNRGLELENELQREARKEANTIARAATRQRAKARLKEGGLNVIKFAARNHKPADKIIVLSKDTQYLQWGDSVDKLSTSIDLKTIVRVEYGDIQVSQRAAGKHAIITTALDEPWQTFFLWDGKRSYDFYVPQESGGTSKAIMAVVGINAARGVSGRSTRTGHFLWKAARMHLRTMAWHSHGDDSHSAMRRVLVAVLSEVGQLSSCSAP